MNAELPLLVVDDEPAIRHLLSRVLSRAGYETVGADGIGSAEALLREGSYALALCDLNLGTESGLDFVRSLRREHPETPALVVSGMGDRASVDAALELGAYGFLLKPFQPEQIVIEVENALHRRRAEGETRSQRERLEHEVAARTHALRSVVTRLEETAASLRTSREETVRRLSRALELRDGATGDHVERLSVACGLVARALGLEPDHCELVRVASPMHDIGKIGIRDRILLKPGPLDPDERREMERHTTIGHELLAGSDSALLELAATIALTHHERPDGTGYPHGLVGDEIPIEGRIVAVCDVFDALSHDRVYRRALPAHEALALLEAGRGTQFDPIVLDAFLSIVDAVDAIDAIDATDATDAIDDEPEPEPELRAA